MMLYLKIDEIYEINKRLIGWVPILVKPVLTIIPDDEESDKWGYKAEIIYGNRELEIATGKPKHIIRNIITRFKNGCIPIGLLQSNENPDGLRLEDAHD